MLRVWEPQVGRGKHSNQRTCGRQGWSFSICHTRWLPHPRSQSTLCILGAQSPLPSPLHPAPIPGQPTAPSPPCSSPPPRAPSPAAACSHWNPCRLGTQLTADRQWYFPSAWISGAGLIQRCFSISLTPHCPALITEMLMSCLAWKWFLHLGARTAPL